MYQATHLPGVRDWLAHRAVATPDRLALVDAPSGRRETYAEVDTAVEECAARLAALGVGVGSHLGVVVSRRPAAVYTAHAAMRVGATLVPLSAKLTPAELGPRAERAELDLLLCEAGTEDAAAAADVPTYSIDDRSDWTEVASDADGGDDEPPDLLDASPSTFDLPEWELDDPLVMLYTSGTTGRPKLVVLTAKNVLASAGASAFRLGHDPADRWCSPLSPASMGGLAPVYRCALYGTGLVLAPTDPAPLARAMAEHGVTGVSLVPVLLERLLDAADLPGGLRTVLLGGAPAPASLIERCAERGVPVAPTYGATETASQIATARPAEATAHPGTVGRPLFMTDVSVVDDRGRPVERGETGELVVAGPTVTPGYYDDPAATAEAFSPHGFRTGDLGYRDDAGRLYVVGRRSERIVTGGETVDPAEVAAAVRSLPGVADAAVVGLPDEEFGERVAALVEPAGDGIAPEELRDALRDRLAGYKLPRTVAVGEIPRTESGTVDRAATRERLLGESQGA